MGEAKVHYNYLDKQFKIGGPLVKQILEDIEGLVKTGQFTLGPQVAEFEKEFAKICGVKYAIGINSGTDALILILRALGIGLGDEVITQPNSFIATANAIRFVGAKPVFVDVTDDYMINHLQIEKAVTSKTKAILPVHLTGNPAGIVCASEIAKRRNLFLIEDACQAIDSSVNGKMAGSWGIAGAFSLHPLKNLNVWGDGGMVTTDDGELAMKITLMRNHGLETRDDCVMVAGNCRLHTIQAVIGLRLITDVPRISSSRIMNATMYSKYLADVDGVKLPPRFANVRQVYHTFVIQVKKRDELQKFLERNGVEVKVHYPIPIHLQKPYLEMGYKKGDFPDCEKQSENIISLPIHQYLSASQIMKVINLIRKFYGAKTV
ncbi:DegT/DnrJ/EryC1/StrS family aminotransferase [Patescibacteria group bacterium]|nr:DegT/DnrJ/EryC1/StrS family aminotransferase [Patescibacteria group bacterium]